MSAMNADINVKPQEPKPWTYYHRVLLTRLQSPLHPISDLRRHLRRHDSDEFPMFMSVHATYRSAFVASSFVGDSVMLAAILHIE